MNDNIDKQSQRRLVQILRYIANIHQSYGLTNSGNGSSNNKKGNDTSSNNIFVCDDSVYTRKGGNDVDELDVPNFFVDCRRFDNDILNYNDEQTPDDCNSSQICFTTDDFRTLLVMEEEDEACNDEDRLSISRAFSFYAARSSKTIQYNRSNSSIDKSSSVWPLSSNKTNNQPKRSRDGSWKITSSPLLSQNHDTDGTRKSCWLRITRLSNSQLPVPPKISDTEVSTYLDDWLKQTRNVKSVKELLTIRRLRKQPKISPSISSRGHQRIRAFLKSYNTYLRKLMYYTKIKGIYNNLFQWMQDNNDSTNELVWGIGQAKMWNDVSGTIINGPLLDVLMQLELSKDGAILLYPRNHTGIELNREVLSALPTPPLPSLHAIIAELDPAELSPGQPSTYVSILKQIAVEMSSDGTFHSSSSTNVMHRNKLHVTEAWCVYSRPKSSSVWARDANVFADQLSKSCSDSSFTCLVSKATYALTHGPSSLDVSRMSSKFDPYKNAYDMVTSLLKWIYTINPEVHKPVAEKRDFKPVFPLPASDSQNRIANMLLLKDYPAVICEGPPGTGKSHTIVNIICSYLCLGKRVLVTSKNSSALSVLRKRLPKTIQELCVDVSSSELDGMRHLQQTVEKLAMRIASVNTELEKERFFHLKDTITELEKEIGEIDSRLSERSESIRQFVRSNEGQNLVTSFVSLLKEVPWLAKTVASLSLEDLESIVERLTRIVQNQNMNLLDKVTGYSLPISDDLLSLVSSKTGSTSFATVASYSKMTLANVPLIGSLTGLKKRASELDASLDKLIISGFAPQCKNDWMDIFHALRLMQDIWMFQKEIWSVYHLKDGWPQHDFLHNPNDLKTFEDIFRKALHAKRCENSTDLDEHSKLAAECRSLDARRSVLSSKLQKLAEELVDTTLVSELSSKFSADAQSALIRFAQLAGKQSFSQPTKLSKMTQRQKRRRQEYLDAFDKCCRFIPCWIMTTSQISDYLPAECLFDLTVIDECSQSDITALPGMLRGHQWLIVGDGKQVSPTESFVSEETLDSLRASLPPVPFASSMLPGQSLFDLCAQAFPQGRVVLNEHFRCAPEIIGFSNDNFYNEELVPMRLPTKSERITPSIVDIRVSDGKKNGKSNVEEAKAIIKYVEDIASKSIEDNPRSIGIISLMGSEQSQLIRSGLLEAIGPHVMAKHNILVGEPPTFQGTERDIIILSMICSKGSSPTQSQLMHFQRANVAMSRARDQLVLFRSLDIQDVPSPEDMKIPILEFFLKWSTNQEDIEVSGHKQFEVNSYHQFLSRVLVDKGYKVYSMGKVWKNGICVEHPDADSRVGLLVECVEDSLQDWYLGFKQQKAIERVGWQCMRVDVVSLATRLDETMDSVVRFLRCHGISQPVIVYDTLEDCAERKGDSVDDAEDNDRMEDERENEYQHEIRVPIDPPDEPLDEHPAEDNTNAYVVVSSDDEDYKRRKVRSLPSARSDPFDVDDSLDASIFGETVELDFLLSKKPQESNKTFASQSDEEEDTVDRNINKSSYEEQEPDEDEPESTGNKLYDSSSTESTRPAYAEKVIIQGDDATLRNDSIVDANLTNYSRRKAKRKVNSVHEAIENDDIESGQQSSSEKTHSLNTESVGGSTEQGGSKRRIKRYRRLEKYQRDGRWLPKNLSKSEYANDSEHSYDTDTDLKEVLKTENEDDDRKEDSDS